MRVFYELVMYKATAGFGWGEDAQFFISKFVWLFLKIWGILIQNSLWKPHLRAAMCDKVGTLLG